MSARPRFATRSAALGLLVAAAALTLTESGARPAQAVATGYGSSYKAAQPEAFTSSSAAKYQFSIGGAVGGMYPGRSQPLKLFVYNPNKVAITVTSIATTVLNASTKCSAANLHVTGFSGNLAVPAGSLASTTVTAAMAHAAPDFCQGAVFPLQYSGQGQVP